MDNVETRVTVGTQATGRRHKKNHNATQTTKKINKTDPNKNPCMNPGAWDAKDKWLLVKTPTVLFI